MKNPILKPSPDLIGYWVAADHNRFSVIFSVGTHSFPENVVGELKTQNLNEIIDWLIDRLLIPLYI